MKRALAFLAMFVAVISAAPAFAAPASGLDLAAWVSKTTDLAVTQVAIAGPDNVYSLEPLGPRVSTGEVLALVRTEAMTPEWGAAHRFQSWDAHMLFDCSGGRVRVLRSASYPEQDRQGPARSDDSGGTWFSPEANTPAATLFAAACDPAFAWPLREGAAPLTPRPQTALIKAAVTSPPPPSAPPGLPIAAPQVAAVDAAPPPAPPGAAVAGPARGDNAFSVAAFASPVAAQEHAVPTTAAASPEPPAVASYRAEAAWPEVGQGPAAARRIGAGIQKASYGSGVQDWPVTSATPGPSRHGGLFAFTSSVARTCKRWGGAGRSWLARGVDYAFRKGDAPPRPPSGSFRQAQAY